MPLTLTEIKQLSTVNLDNFEIRGAKFGLKNARTTGPLFDSGYYYPPKTVLLGDGVFTPNDSTVAGINFDPPYSLDATSFKIGDYFITGVDATYKIAAILSPTSVVLDGTSSLSGFHTFTTSLISRDYLIESDTGYNTIDTGYADFTPGSDIVNGYGTSWASVSVGDLIKSVNYHRYYIVKGVSGSQIQLTAGYGGPLALYSEYMIKRKKIDTMHVQYVKDDFIYEKNGGRWKYDATTGSDISASSTTFLPLADGINLKFTQSLTKDVPDLVDSMVALDKVLVKSTLNIMPQFPLPVVPNPESSFQLRINGQRKDMFPDGDRDYIINYWQSPIYLAPPPVKERKVANLMFLQGIKNVVLDPVSTSSGIINFTDGAGNTINGVLSGSETVVINDTTQAKNIDYVFEANAGYAEKSEHYTNEQIVKYVGVRCSNIIDYGIIISLNGKRQTLSFPPNSADDVKFTLETGRLRPIDRNHPGPSEEYIVDYLVDSAAQVDQQVTLNAGDTFFRTSYYPIADNSIILLNNGNPLEEGSDFRVSYQTGRIVFPGPLTDSSTFSISYTPLSKMVNGVSYHDGVGYCTVYDSRLTIINPSIYSFQLQNTVLNPTDATFLRIYNETRNKAYDLSGIDFKTGISLALNSTNLSIGLDSEDIVVVDYTFIQDGIEYAPISTSGLVVSNNTDKLYIVGRNAVSTFTPGSIVRLTPSDDIAQYLFSIKSSDFDGEDTVVTFDSSSSADIINPDVYVTDSSVSFIPLGINAQNIESGKSSFIFTGSVSDKLRRGTALRIEKDYYSVTLADSSVVTVGSVFPRDYTSSSILSSIYYSDVPIYYEGETEISASQHILNNTAPAMVLSYGYGVLTANSDTSKLSIIGVDHSNNIFNYSDYPTVASLSSALTSVLDMTVGSFVTDWTSSKIFPVTDMAITTDSSSLVSIYPALRLNGTDVTDYIISEGLVNLNHGVSKNDRYNLDYLGRQPLGDSTVTVSASFFVNLPKGSELIASFQYDNLDQFYIQVMGQREFLETVIVPRVKEEAIQQSGNMGQGGEIPDDADQGNAAGGLAGDEFRRVDAAIECRIDKNIFDYFNDRATAYGREMYAMTGWRLCNNDGLLSETDQSAGTRSFNRMYPNADYTNLEPAFVNPLTGQSIPPYTTAIFTNNSMDVTCKSVDFGIQSKWQTQLRAGDFIRRVDSTVAYQIDYVASDTHLFLTTDFSSSNGSSTSPYGDQFEMFSAYSPYDDDGHVGAKIASTKVSNFGLKDNDVFDLYLDSSYQSYTFKDPTGLFERLFYPLSSYSSQNVAGLFSAYFNGLQATVEWVLEPNGYGYRNSMVLRTRNDTTFNCIRLGDGNAVIKLGFTPYSIDSTKGQSCGNINRIHSDAELFIDQQELPYVTDERQNLTNLLSFYNKLDRIPYANLATNVYKDVSAELPILASEQIRITEQLGALNTLLAETSGIGPLISSTNHANAMYNKDTTFQADTSAAQIYANAVYPNWQGKIDGTRWALDLDSTALIIRGTTGLVPGGVAITNPSLSDTTISGQTSFILQVDPSYDRRILDNTADGIFVLIGLPDVVANNTYFDFVGNWSGWDPSVGNLYSLKNDATFTLNPYPLFVLKPDGTTVPGPLSYSVDTSAVRINYGPVPTDSSVFLLGLYNTIGTLKTAINDMGGVDATGNVSYDSYTSIGIKIDSGVISPDATLFLGLRECSVYYETISDKMLSDRSSFDSTRITQLNVRIPSLLGRETQVRGDVTSEELFRAMDGDTGNLYNWADNRFNRGNGCEAKLVQITSLMERNKSALEISKRMMS